MFANSCHKFTNKWQLIRDSIFKKHTLKKKKLQIIKLKISFINMLVFVQIIIKFKIQMFLSNNTFSICIKLEIVSSNKITSTKPESFIIPNSSFINILSSPILLLSIFYHPQFFSYQYFIIPNSSFINFIIPDSSLINILSSLILLLSIFYHPQFFSYQYFIIPDSSFINILSSPILLLSIFYHPRFFSYQYFIIPDCSGFLSRYLSGPLP